VSQEPNKDALTRRDFLKLIGSAVLSAMLGRVNTALAASTGAFVLEHGSRRRPYVALTYDDCYNIQPLQELERILDDHPNVKVTFFPVGEALLTTDTKDPGIWKRFAQRGHEIGYHSFSHIGANVMSTDSLIKDYDKWYAALTQVLGAQADVKFARPTFGIVSESLHEMCQERKLVAVLWSTGWGGPYTNAARAIRETNRGDIVLLHTRPYIAGKWEDINNTREGLKINAERGLRFSTLSDLYFAFLLDELGFETCPVSPSDKPSPNCPQ